MKYFFLQDNVRHGPLSLEEIRQRKVGVGTLVWRTGLPRWLTARELAELYDDSLPPPTPPSEASPRVRLTPPPPPAVAVAPARPLKEELRYDPELDPVSRLNQRSLLADLFSFEGRLRRRRYILVSLVVFIYQVTVQIIASVIDGENSPFLLLLAPSVWISIAEGAKRCHDRGNSGWFQVIPFYQLWMTFGEGESRRNHYGPNPKTHPAEYTSLL